MDKILSRATAGTKKDDKVEIQSFHCGEDFKVPGILEEDWKVGNVITYKYLEATLQDPKNYIFVVKVNEQIVSLVNKI